MKKLGIIALLAVLILGMFVSWSFADDNEKELPSNRGMVNVELSLQGNTASGYAMVYNSSIYTAYTTLTLQYLNDSGVWCYSASNSGYGRRVDLFSSITCGTYRLKATTLLYNEDGSVANSSTVFSSTQTN